jgi:hypothetical protein
VSDPLRANFSCFCMCVQAAVVQIFWARIVNRDAVPHLLRTLPRAAQLLLGGRLGWRNVASAASPDGVYQLDLRRPDDRELAARLFRMAVDLRGRTLNNLLVAGVAPAASLGLQRAG